MIIIEWISCPLFWARGFQASFNIFYIQITLKFIHTSSASLLASLIYSPTHLTSSQMIKRHLKLIKSITKHGGHLIYYQNPPFSSPTLPLVLGILIPPPPYELTGPVGFQNAQSPKSEISTLYHLVEYGSFERRKEESHWDLGTQVASEGCAVTIQEQGKSCFVLLKKKRIGSKLVSKIQINI